MHRRFALSICALVLIASCGEIAADRVVVGGTGSEEFLNLRAGPGLGFRVVLGLPDGTVLNRILFFFYNAAIYRSDGQQDFRQK